MKEIFFSIAVTAVAIILQSCSPKPIFYHSEANLPYYHRSTKTVFELIKDGNSSSTFQFGVIAANDNDTLSYVLLAPSVDEKNVKELVDVNLSYSVPLLPKQVKELVNILNSSVENWTKKYGDKNGISYEYLISPENLIIQQSENVAIWCPTFKFYFQNNEDGPLGKLLFGEGLLKYYCKLGKLSEIKDLVNMLNVATKNK